jgi:hypothetical protein
MANLVELRLCGVWRGIEDWKSVSILLVSAADLSQTVTIVFDIAPLYVFIPSGKVEKAL